MSRRRNACLRRISAFGLAKTLLAAKAKNSNEGHQNHSDVFFKTELENVAIANALQLEAARRHAGPLRFNFVAGAKF